MVFGSALLSMLQLVLSDRRQASKQETYRVLIKGTNSAEAMAKQNYGKRWDFGGEGFTTTVNSNQYLALKKNINLKVELVPEVTLNTTVEIKPGDASALAIPSDQTPWGIAAIYNDSAIQSTSGGDGVMVAVLDTWINRNHPDLAGNVEQCLDFTQTSAPIINGACVNRQGHGTHVSGTALANVGSTGSGIFPVLLRNQSYGDIKY